MAPPLSSYFRYLKMLKDFDAGSDRVGDLLEVVTFLAEQHPAMRQEINELVGKLRKMLRRHERKRKGGGAAGARRKEQPQGKRAAAAEAGRIASSAVGMQDACLRGVEWTHAKAKELLVTRSIFVHSSEYVEAEVTGDGDGDGDGFMYTAVIKKVLPAAADGSIHLELAHADGSTEEMEVAEVLERLEALSALSLERLAGMPRRVLLGECKARAFPGISAKKVEALADLLAAEYSRLRDPVEEGEDEGQEGREGVEESGGGDDAPSGGQPRDGQEEPMDLEHSTDLEQPTDLEQLTDQGTDADELTALDAELKHAADHANQQQLNHIENLFTKVAASTGRYVALTNLLLSLAWPAKTTTAAPPAPTGPSPPLPFPPPPSAQPLQPPQVPPTPQAPCASPQSATIDTGVALSRLVEMLPSVTFGQVSPPGFEDRLSQRADLREVSLNLKSELTQVITWMRKLATQLFVCKVSDPYCVINATIGRYGVWGQMSHAPLKLGIAYITKEFGDLSKSMGLPGGVDGFLGYDGEACNLLVNPHPGAGPTSNHSLAVHSEAMLNVVKARVKHDVVKIVDTIRQHMEPHTVPACVQHVGYLLKAPTLPGSDAVRRKLAAAKQRVEGHCEMAALLLQFGLILPAGATRPHCMNARFVRPTATGYTTLLRSLDGVIRRLGEYTSELEAACAAMRYRQVDYIIESQLMIDAASSGEDAEALPQSNREDAAALLELWQGNLVKLALWLDDQLEVALDAASSGEEQVAAAMPSEAALPLSREAVARAALRTDDAEAAGVVAAAQWLRERVERLGSMSAAVSLPLRANEGLPPYVKQVFEEQALLRPPPQTSLIDAALPITQTFWETPDGYAGHSLLAGMELPSFDGLLANTDFLYRDEEMAVGCRVWVKDGRVKFRWWARPPVERTQKRRSQWTSVGVQLRAQRLAFVPEAVRIGSLTLPQLFQELHLRLHEQERLMLVRTGRRLDRHFSAVPPDAWLEAECPEHKDKNCVQRISKMPENQSHIISRAKIIGAARALIHQNPRRNITLSAPFFRQTDMQCAPAMQWPLLSPELQRMLRIRGAATEAVFLRAMGWGTRGLTFPGLTYQQRVLLVSVLRQSAVLNIFGDQLCLPFGGGEGLRGVRAGHVQGLVGGNLRALLTHGDALVALHDRYTQLAPMISMAVLNTNDLEVGFSAIWSAAGGCMPEFFAVERGAWRIELLEMVQSDDAVNFEARRRNKIIGKYAGSVNHRMAVRIVDSSGEGIDPNSDVSLGKLEAVEDVAVHNATATNDTVRALFKDKGIGKV